jgi:hypothetical protein
MAELGYQLLSMERKLFGMESGYAGGSSISPDYPLSLY